ncbi:hypothetical protein DSM21852_08540 [Methylocystis bryophila]|nr:hypothetical protein DSM21852_08540 [Methylocystis bryophila]
MAQGWPVWRAKLGTASAGADKPTTTKMTAAAPRAPRSLWAPKAKAFLGRERAAAALEDGGADARFSLGKADSSR